jgi:hypothetical protein
MMKKLLAFLTVFAVLGAVFAGNYNYRGNTQTSQYNSERIDYSIPTYNSQSPRQGTYDNSRANPYPYSEKKTGSYGQTYYVGPKGGEYYINSNSNRTYYNSTPNYSTPVYQGERGGNYYYNRNGNKIYIRTK